jgi:hypothetical protein
MKMNVKALLAATLFATAGFVAQSAQAAVPTYTEALNLVDFSSDFGNDVAGKGTIFVDHFTFTVGASEFDGGFYANQGKKDGISISGFNLLDTLGNVVATGSGFGGGWNIASTSIGAGSYALEVIGTVTGSIHGSYAGTLNVSPVPEPETYGMMLGGLALLGVVARRKAKKAA